jgi:hypothetical protein
MNIHGLTMEPEGLSQKELSEINGGNPLGVIVRTFTFIAAATTLGGSEEGSMVERAAKPLNDLYKREMKKLRDKQ